MNPITLQNNITRQVICKENLLSKNVLCDLQALGYNEAFCYQAAAVCEWLNTLSLEDYADVKQVIKLLK